MSRQIKEVMELVKVLTTAVHVSASKYAVEGSTKEVQALIKCKQKARKNLETKLLELMPGWQPIESAPKDGSAILGYFDGCIEAIGFCRSYSTWMTIWDSTDCKPTHWMPLPKAPE